MILFELIAESGHRVSILGKGLPSDPIFFVEAGFSDKLFLEECILRQFNSFRVSPHQLFSFLKNDPLISKFFPTLSFSEATSSLLNSDFTPLTTSSFSSLPLGEKLILAGAFNRDKLNFLLDSFQSSSETVRFGEYLRRHLLLPSRFIDFLVDPSIKYTTFNNYKIGERLVFLGFISQSDIDRILIEQKSLNNPFAQIAAKNNFMLTNELGDFIASVQLDDSGNLLF